MTERGLDLVVRTEHPFYSSCVRRALHDDQIPCGYRHFVPFPSQKEGTPWAPSPLHSNGVVHQGAGRQASQSAAGVGKMGGNSAVCRQPDRNPLYAAADPPASGRCPTARGPSVGLAAPLEKVFPLFPLEAVDDRFDVFGALFRGYEEGVRRVDYDKA